MSRLSLWEIPLCNTVSLAPQERMRVKTSHLRCLTRHHVLVDLLNFGDYPPCRLATVDNHDDHHLLNGNCHRETLYALHHKNGCELRHRTCGVLLVTMFLRSN